MPVQWVEVRYACDCKAIVSVNAIALRVACEHCGKTTELAREWSIALDPGRDQDPHSPLEVTARPVECARCHVCNGAIPEADLEGTTSRRTYGCACGASICVRPIPDDLARAWGSGLVVGEDEDRLDDGGDPKRRRARRRFYACVSRSESDRVAKQQRTARQKRKVEIFLRERLPETIATALEARRRGTAFTLLACTVVTSAAELLAIHRYGASLSQAPLRLIAGLVLFGLLLLMGILALRYARYRALVARSVVVLAHRKDDAFVFELDGAPHAVRIARTLFSKRARSPRAAFLALSPEDPTVALLAHAADDESD
jgi:hypothetical protein